MMKHILLAILISITPVFAQDQKPYVVDLYTAVKNNTGILSYLIPYDRAERAALSQAKADGETLETVYWQAIEYANSLNDATTATALKKSFTTQYCFGTAFWVCCAVIGTSVAGVLTLAGYIKRKSALEKKELEDAYGNLHKLREDSEINTTKIAGQAMILAMLEKMKQQTERPIFPADARLLQVAVRRCRTRENLNLILIDEMQHLHDSEDWWNKHLSKLGIETIKFPGSNAGAPQSKMTRDDAYSVLSQAWTALCTEREDLRAMGPLRTDASTDEIKARYKKLAMRWHPDKNNNDPAAAEMFGKIDAAAKLLGAK